MGRSSELRDRFRSSVIWHACYAEHERHPLCQSLILQPQLLFIASFFPQQPFQLGWLYRLYKLGHTKSNAERQDLGQ
jgi:hypothetical protein